jgi:hypothetical protein
MWTHLPEFGAEAAAFDAYIRAAGEDPSKLPDGPVADKLWNAFSRDSEAAKSADPGRFKREWDAHGAARDAHFQRIEAERPPPSLENVVECMAWFHQVREEARALASADGCPDPVEVARRKSLPRSTLRDLQDSAVSTAEDHVFERIRAEQRAAAPEPEDKLRWFRDQTPPGVPPYWPDS